MCMLVEKDLKKKIWWPKTLPSCKPTECEGFLALEDMLLCLVYAVCNITLVKRLITVSWMLQTRWLWLEGCQLCFRKNLEGVGSIWHFYVCACVGGGWTHSLMQILSQGTYCGTLTHMKCTNDPWLMKDEPKGADLIYAWSSSGLGLRCWP